jgi:predicted transcriptional regulator
MTEPDIDQTISISTENHTDGVLIEAIALPETPGQGAELGVRPPILESVQTAETVDTGPVSESVPPPAGAIETASPPIVIPTVAPVTFSDEDRRRAKARKQQIKEAKFLEILKYVEAHGEVSNDAVEKLVSVSDTTAAKYLKELVKSGKLQKIGRGWQTKYIETNPTS